MMLLVKSSQLKLNKILVGLVFAFGIIVSQGAFANQSCYVDDYYIRGVYTGDCVDGKAHGQGESKGINHYKGYFVKGEKEGKGIYTWADGDKYEGEWHRDRRDGKGIYTYRNGSKYDGGWHGGDYDDLGELSLIRGDDSIQGWERKNAGSWEGNFYVVRGLFARSLSGSFLEQKMNREQYNNAIKERENAQLRAKQAQAEQPKLQSDFRHQLATNPVQLKANLMTEGMWYDERTGLVWSRCSVGQTWTGTTCTGEIKKYNWSETQEVAKSYYLGGYNDWQVPSMHEFRTILNYCAEANNIAHEELSGIGFYTHCDKPLETHVESGFALDTSIFLNLKPTKGEDNLYWTSNDKLVRFTFGSNSFGVSPFGNMFDWSACVPRNSNSGKCSHHLLLVNRAFSLGDKNIANTIGQTFTNKKGQTYMQVKTEEERLAKEKATREAEQARKEQEAYNRKVANFRKNLKVGDDATAGMVIEIKGNLIKIQTNDRQCSQKDYNGKCMNYVNTPVEKWVKRSELHPY